MNSTNEVSGHRPACLWPARIVLWALAAVLLLNRGDMAPAVLHGTPPEILAGNSLGGRMWVHVDRPGRHRTHFRIYQLNPLGNDGKGTGWYHEGDFAEWMTESLSYSVRGDELTLRFELAREHTVTRFRVERARGPDGEDLQLTLTPDPRRYWKPYVYWAHSRPREAESLLERLR